MIIEMKYFTFKKRRAKHHYQIKQDKHFHENIRLDNFFIWLFFERIRV